MLCLLYQNIVVFRRFIIIIAPNNAADYLLKYNLRAKIDLK